MPSVNKGMGFKSVSSAHNIHNLKLDDHKAKPVNKKIIKRKVKERKVVVCKNEFDCEIKPLKPLYFPEFDHK